MADEELIQDGGEMPEEQETPTADAGGEELSEMRAEMERMRAALKDANADAKNNRLKAKELADAQAAAERAAAEEQGKYQELYEQASKQLEEERSAAQQLRDQMQQSRINAALTDAARSLNFADPGDVSQFVAADAVELDDNGTPINADALVKELASSKPYLLQRTAAPNINAQSGNGSAPQAGQMSEQQIAEMAALLGLRPESIKDGLGAE